MILWTSWIKEHPPVICIAPHVPRVLFFLSCLHLFNRAPFIHTEILSKLEPVVSDKKKKSFICSCKKWKICGTDIFLACDYTVAEGEEQKWAHMLRAWRYFKVSLQHLFFFFKQNVRSAFTDDDGVHPPYRNLLVADRSQWSFEMMMH